MTLYDVTYVNADGIRVTFTREFRSAVVAVRWLAINAPHMAGATVLPTKGAGEIAKALGVEIPECRRRAS